MRSRLSAQQTELSLQPLRPFAAALARRAVPPLFPAQRHLRPLPELSPLAGTSPNSAVDAPATRCNSSTDLLTPLRARNGPASLPSSNPDRPDSAASAPPETSAAWATQSRTVRDG